MPHSAVRLTTDSPSASKTTWSTMKSQTPSLDSENSSKLLTPDIGNAKENSPVKPELPDLLEASPNTSPTLTSPITSLAKVLPIPNRTTTTLALPRARAQLPNRRSPSLPTSPKLGKDGKLTPQECRHHLDNKLCLFCGTAGHITKDCPKSSLASAKAQVSKSDQDKSASSSMDLKKD